MKKLLFVVLIIVFLITGAISAEESETDAEISVEEICISEEEGIKVKEVGVKEIGEVISETAEEDVDFEFDFSEIRNFKMNYGPVVSCIFFNSDSLNEHSEIKEMNLDKFNDELFLFGSGGIIGLRDGSRIGKLSMSGTERVSNEDRKAALDIEYTGFIYERGIYADEKTDLALGSMIGTGNVNLTIRHNEEEGFNVPHGAEFNKNILVFKPHINLHCKLAGFVGLDLSGGYFWTYNRDGKWDVMGKEVVDTTDDFKGPVANLRLSFGF